MIGEDGPNKGKGLRCLADLTIVSRQVYDSDKVANLAALSTLYQ